MKLSTLIIGLNKRYHVGLKPFKYLFINLNIFINFTYIKASPQNFKFLGDAKKNFSDPTRPPQILGPDFRHWLSGECIRYVIIYPMSW